MALQVPNLDDRTFQDIVSEVRSKIPLYCPKWTDYNLSDPGITLIEMFAWIADIMLYRVNRVPEKNYIKFMDLIGIKLELPKAATAEVTFRLTAPQTDPFVIPRETEIATVTTETLDAIVFTTNKDFTILVPSLKYALTTYDDAVFEDIIPTIKHPDRQITVFREVPEENDALYLGYGEDLRGHILLLTVESSIEGIGVDPHNPPWSWEFWDGERDRWSPLILESDTTGGFNTNGQIKFRIPTTSAMKEIDGQRACWVRCRTTKPFNGQSAYQSSPKVRSVISESIGGSVMVSHSQRISGEVLGWSDGSAGQKFQLQNFPILLRKSGETLEVETGNEGEFEAWREVDEFANTGSDDPHFTLDGASGEIQLGPLIRHPSGEERQYGRVLPKGRQIRFASYRLGGGVVGNVGEETITALRSAIPYVDSVTNYEAATGGTDAETLESAKLRAPKILKTNIRAVTAEDFEYLAKEVSSHVARAKCISPGDSADGQSPQPGVVRLLLVPSVLDTEGYLPIEELELARPIREQVQQYLDERRLLATRLEIGSPEYISVAVSVQVRAKKYTIREQIAANVEMRLYQYINPIRGGADGNGWPFGRSLSLPEIYAALQGIKGVDYVEEVSIFPVDTATGTRQDARARVDISPYSLICSHKHEVTVVEQES